MDVQKELVGTTLKVKISGVIDENTSFISQIGTGFKELDVDCLKISRLNSMGVKYWINYFSGLTNSGTKVSLQKCSPAIMDQMSLVDTFHSNCHIESVMVPYECVNCKSESVTEISTKTLRVNLEIPDGKCPKCSNKSVFADIAEEYFAFLDYTK
jgi:anti-anti-sigma regulatory factor/DNA-directed RNA polymerase subunit RPC12/RpoP